MSMDWKQHCSHFVAVEAECTLESVGSAVQLARAEERPRRSGPFAVHPTHYHLVFESGSAGAKARRRRLCHLAKRRKGLYLGRHLVWR